MANTASDQEAIGRIETDFNAAWNAHDAGAMVASLVEDAQFVTVNGVWSRSRAAYRELIARLHAGPFKTSKRETLELIIRLLGAEVALVHARFLILGDIGQSGQIIPAREGVSTRVVQKLNGVWKTISVQNTDVAGRRT